ncbi:MAG: 4-(cytidine 5'-diphospho)-2-C-methyl-D-erythritol kinase [Lachnospiraceae bacterium]|nr:4-(cytidine 5'-diphospho)-2-C-methyl-D-erythritol kinase [Sarcina sp.]MBQ6591242.1 4-(cytidine 5'-diphospho)-2-C-methyl-D-erythritol kinase [Lachnospiraceae bacterium]
MKKTITKQACAKINLGLDVVGVREDGYHLLRMIMQQIDLHDTLTVTVTEPGENGGEIRLIDESGLTPAGGDNLIIRAVRAMTDKYDLHADIEVRLAKRIPVAAGLAGGSTDAAAAFCAVRDLLVPGVPDGELMEMAVRLGADIPYCIAGGTRLAEGIGEKLTELPPMPECAIVLVKPEASASTANVYRSLDALSGYHHPDIDGQIEALRAGDLEGLVGRCENVLELVTGSQVPVIGRIEKFFMEHGAAAACMSGSGPTVFAVYRTKEDAEEAKEAFMKTKDAEGCGVYVCRPCH